MCVIQCSFLIILSSFKTKKNEAKIYKSSKQIGWEWIYLVLVYKEKGEIDKRNTQMI